MSLRHTLINHWKSVATYQISIGLIILLILWKVGWQAAIAGLFIGELFHVKWWIEVKEKMVIAQPR